GRSACSRAVESLEAHFDRLMSFALHLSILSDPHCRQSVEQLLSRVRGLRDEARARLEQDQYTEELEQLAERLDDYLWQIEREGLQGPDRTVGLMPDPIREAGPGRGQHFLAWGLEQVLASLDKLEVRGRDSAGIAVTCVLPPDASPEAALDEAE